ncbi:sensor histidine kinase [Bartonella bacilliformis]|uniref:sensor histidine kinase n=1 Tax=Bartonella bacilliformis TaxID=774 RepID=UPI0004A03B93|nr:sensor histidine kinase [Bartonella bacilliformis]KEG24678.1 hypothetical protein H708_00222 [Bartonella bacilliformis VAB9028]
MTAFSKRSSLSSTTPRWRWGCVIISLLMAILASFLITLLSNTVNQELEQLNISSELREQADLMLISLVDMATANRRYEDTRHVEDKTFFAKAVRDLEDLLKYTSLIVYSHPEWYDWFASFKKEIEVRKHSMIAHMVALDAFHGPSAESPSFPEITKLQMASLPQLMTRFINGDGLSRQKQREGITIMRTTLTLAAIVSVVISFLLAYIVINRFYRDVYSLKTYQLLLHTENSALEARVKERTEKLEKARNHAEKERQRVEMLLQDASHRIGNSLSIVSSLLALQMNRSQNEEVRSILGAARDRVRTISTAYRRLRLNDDMETTLLADFLNSVVHDVELAVPFELRENITIHTDFKDCRLSARDATTLGIILGELLTNALKYAFPDQRPGNLYISFGSQDDGRMVLTVVDDGVGMNSQNVEGKTGFGEKTGLGHLVIEQLCMQFGAKPLFETSELGGTKVTIPLPKLTTHDDTKKDDESVS